MPEFDVNDHDDGVELLPDFFTGELSPEERKKYRKLRDKFATQDGGIIIDTSDYEPGERVSLSELIEEQLEEENTTLADKMYGTYACK